MIICIVCLILFLLMINTIKGYSNLRSNAFRISFINFIWQLSFIIYQLSKHLSLSGVEFIFIVLSFIYFSYMYLRNSLRDYNNIKLISMDIIFYIIESLVIQFMIMILNIIK